MAEKCKVCGCKCAHCNQNDQQHSEMQLHIEIENLRQRLLERDNHIVTMETQFLSEADKFPNGELASMKEEITIWEDKYSRLLEAHKRIQKVNQNLEDKLLRIVDKCETEKGAFTKDIATLSHRLADANYTIHRLTQDNEKYRNDVNLAIQLLQCKPSNFVGQKYDSLPSEVQAKVRTYISQKRHPNENSLTEAKSITVPISTFPPTAMVYNITKPSAEKYSDDDSDDSKPPVDVVSAAIMAKVLEDREKERIFSKHCDTCTCHRSILTVDAETQTSIVSNLTLSDNCPQQGSKATEKFKNTFTDFEKSNHTKEHQNVTPFTNNVSMQLYSAGSCRKSTHSSFLYKDEMPITKIGISKDENRTNVNLKSNLNKKSLIRRNDLPNQLIHHNQNELANKQPSFSSSNDVSLNKVNADKLKCNKMYKKTDHQIDNESANHYNRSEKTYSNNYIGLNGKENGNSELKEPSPVDIINDRLWKNQWIKMKSETNLNDKNKNKIDGALNVINNRDWKNDKPDTDLRQQSQLTLIEVKSIDNSMSQSNRQLDIATSPSYSGDSVVISTSDPSSSSSDVVQTIHDRQLLSKNGTSKLSSQNRATSARNCLVRVSPGSKNILLDNAGNYKTVFYANSNIKSGTASVHCKKSRPASEKSTSTNSEDDSPILLRDNNQLRRVAEWVQSSSHVDNTADTSCDNLNLESSLRNKKTDALIYLDETKSMSSIVKDDSLFYDGSEKFTNVPPTLSNTDNDTQDDEKDLITFDTTPEDLPFENRERSNSSSYDFDVQITKEMEETYLKLAASLDPAALKLPNSSAADLTIEKYRKDYKRFHIQRIQDKTGSTT